MKPGTAVNQRMDGIMEGGIKYYDIIVIIPRLFEVDWNGVEGGGLLDNNPGYCTIVAWTARRFHP